MNAELDDLYQQVILDHNKRPRNFRTMEGGRKAEGYNPLCGDRLTVFLEVDDNDVIRDASFQGSGCAISKASASLMTEVLKGKPRAEVEALFEGFHTLVTGREPSRDAGQPEPDLGKLRVFSGVREFPMRVKCATLAWHTMRAALEDRADVATTE